MKVDEYYEWIEGDLILSCFRISWMLTCFNLESTKLNNTKYTFLYMENTGKYNHRNIAIDVFPNNVDCYGWYQMSPQIVLIVNGTLLWHYIEDH